MTAPVATAVIGGGLIGAAWAALFAHHGHAAAIFEPDPPRRADLAARVRSLRRQLQDLTPDQGGALVICGDIAAALAHADIIVESAPERLDLKVALLAEIDALAKPGAIIATSTSSLLLSDMTRDCKLKGRFIVAHPFNPPHLMPLVELFGHDAAILERADAFFRALGKVTIRLKKEVPGHIANRLGAALWQEAVHLVASGVADVADIDTALIHGPAMRWAVQGTHLTYHLGGGPGGIRHYLDHLGPSQERRWASLGKVQLTSDVKKMLIDGIEREANGRSVADLEAERDRFLIDLLKLRDHL
ncbi:3-hydroxyacyl-CoA dehydrogenase NAD-binding domain-containing protein [Dongia rigui]|uniref:3-hydroxyacyl-CoA dehydrogenase NAD-binding domain-containing protein n=1 Tax=Dongia rigui TaxID=940149 RepID=A0ABU5E217_9PROT|nr:3-hydroxyacyl-CoA dehydrogenase NAD-binding domain-containing protein [Dongia rigui]MDY0873402.1 3-hydroxyacyl-CoA dehydrogenase NAD-binding domain-containing protein [Dongia rigui]